MSEKCHLSPEECASIGLAHKHHCPWEQDHICRVILQYRNISCKPTKYKVIYQLVEKHNLQLTKLIKLFENTNISGYYKWLQAHKINNQCPIKSRNKDYVRRIYEAHPKHIGCRKIATILNEQYNIKLNYKTINQYMKSMGLCKNHKHDATPTN
ncbi:transposase [Ureaplasma sp. ES3154-GEN]|uniref:transposase n=1 Tax=Ureaplasma sp. ES3154-GEN TaxID=2984844 RepID=UPI0021E9AE01|nr:transposase [Ureaplasma sp. ES3154-GEN]MCV3743812.1 transposase [Ureaplasma sp. ES3154-GEN]